MLFLRHTVSRAAGRPPAVSEPEDDDSILPAV